MKRNEKQNIHFSQAHQSTARLSRVACAAPNATVVHWHQWQQSLLQVVTMCIDGLILASVSNVWLLHNMHITHCALHTHILAWGAQYNAHGLRCWEKPQAVALGDIWLDTVHKMHVLYNVVDTEYAHYALCRAIWCKEKPQSVALGDRRDGWRRQRRHHLPFSSSLSYLSSLPSLSTL